MDRVLDHRPPRPLACDISDWLLDPRVAFLNHGSFGAMPRVVFDEQDRWRRRIEAELVEYLGRRCDGLIEEAKTAIGRFLSMRPADFGLVTNATEGINAVLRSLPLKPGDELLTTTHVYNAIRQTMRYVARQAGADYREVDLPLPVESAEQIAAAVLRSVSDRTRLLVIDHVTSPTALVFPVARIVAECARRGVDVLVDGAHAPGMLDLDVPAIGAAYYTGNLHKWVCAPRGSAFLWVRPDRQGTVHPNIISHNLDQGFAREFAWQGTRDISSTLATPRAIEFLGRFGWANVYQHNHELAAWAHEMLCRRWGVEPVSPIDGQLLGSMAAVRLPGRLAELTEQSQAALQQRLYEEFQAEAPLVRWDGMSLIRVSCQLYNRPGDYHRLGEAIGRMAEL